jgi:segregation and condensation protein B
MTDPIAGRERAALEAVLMVLDEPTSATDLAAGLNLTVAAVEALLLDLQRDYDGYTVKAPDRETGSNGPEHEVASSPRGFELRNVAGGWRIYSTSSVLSSWKGRQPG